MDNPDLGSYYHSGFKKIFEEVKAVGWLKPEIEFTTGEVSEQSLDKLRRLVLSNAFIGHDRVLYSCPLCKTTASTVTILDGKQVTLYKDELWIPALEDYIFAAPIMICHYIETHAYLPPRIFLDAVDQFDLSSDWNGQLAFIAISSKYHVDPALAIGAGIYLQLILQREFTPSMEGLENAQQGILPDLPAAKEMLEKVNFYKKTYIKADE
jgi:hypothetical protein